MGDWRALLRRPQADLEPLLAKSTAAKDAGGVELLVVLHDIFLVRRPEPTCSL